MSETPERIVPSCVEALENYQQADMDGIMVLASRQAIHETIDAYWARVKTCEELEAKLARLRAACSPIHEAADECDEWNHDDDNQAPVDAGTCRAIRAELMGGKDE